MSWLHKQQERLDKEQQERDREKQERVDADNRRTKSAESRAEKFALSMFDDLVGKMCYTNGVIDTDKEDATLRGHEMGKFHFFLKRQTIELFAGDKQLATLFFGWQENQSHDGDSWRVNGSYRNYEKMYLLLPWKQGKKRVAPSACDRIDENDLGEYLLNFITLE